MVDNKFYFKKSKGQNFLINQDIIDTIINQSSLKKNKTAVIEIGPGDGALTDKIITRCKKIVIIEIDNQLINILEEKYKTYKNIVIIKEDILSVNLQKLIKEHLNDFEKEDITVISNLPYYITSPILFKLLSIRNFISSFVLMMQKEVGERILAKVDESKYNNLSIITNLYCDINKIVNVSKNDFNPKPKVDSVVLKFIINEKYNILNEMEFLSFVRKMFNNRRKIILNNLINYLDCNKKEGINFLINVNIDPNFRPQNISTEQYYNLWNKINSNSKI